MSRSRDAARLAEARLAFEAGDLAAAEAAARAVVSQDKRNANAWQLIGLVMNQRGWFDQAVPCFEKIVRLHPDDPMAHCQLAFARMYQGRFDAAEKGFATALEKRPGHATATRGRAELLERRGDPEAAYALLAPAPSINPPPPRDPESQLLLAQLAERTKRDDEARRIAMSTLARDNVQPATQRKLRFVLARIADRSGEHIAALDAYRDANRTDARPFDPARTKARFERLMSIFAKDRRPPLPRSTVESDRPVFIVGLPRSGSTLVEQILDAHPDAFGAGELTTFTDLVAALPAKIGATLAYPDWIESLPADGKVLERLVQPYLRHLTKLDRDARRVADKNLLNARHLGLISLLIPRARVIICERDPVENGLSCFLNDLSPVGFPWSTDLESIGRFVRLHERLMNHWRNVLDLPILTVKYEALVDAQEDVTRELLAFCDLPWDDRVLRFYETGRAVTTLSYDQVRRPIYRTAIARSARYGAALDPLRAALAEDA